MVLKNDGYIYRGGNFVIFATFLNGINSPADIWCENDVVLTSMRRDHVASTLIQRHFGTKCPLGRKSIQQINESISRKPFFFLNSEIESDNLTV